MRVHLVTTNPALCSVLADDLDEIDGMEVHIVDVRLLDGDSSPKFDDVVIVAEAALRAWRRARGGLRIDSSAVQVVGSLGSFWALQRHPESLGFDGYVDFKWPTRQIVRELARIRSDRAGLEGTNVHRIRPLSQEREVEVELDSVERRIVAYITMGLTDREIAEKIHFSSQTVRNRVSRLLVRFHVCNRTQLAMMCAQDSRIVDGRPTTPESAPFRANVQ
jgi:DNA-binding CsgD family transcriptional regulator